MMISIHLIFLLISLIFSFGKINAGERASPQKKEKKKRSKRTWEGLLESYST